MSFPKNGRRKDPTFIKGVNDIWFKCVPPKHIERLAIRKYLVHASAFVSAGNTHINPVATNLWIKFNNRKQSLWAKMFFNPLWRRPMLSRMLGHVNSTFYIWRNESRETKILRTRGSNLWLCVIPAFLVFWFPETNSLCRFCVVW